MPFSKNYERLRMMMVVIRNFLITNYLPHLKTIKLFSYLMKKLIN